MSIDYNAAYARAEFYADTIGVHPPDRILSEDGQPAPELMAFCLRYGASLDWVFLGDMRGLIRDSYELAQDRE